MMLISVVSWISIIVFTCLILTQHDQYAAPTRRLLASDVTELGGVTARSFRDLILQGIKPSEVVTATTIRPSSDFNVVATKPAEVQQQVSVLSTPGLGTPVQAPRNKIVEKSTIGIDSRKSISSAQTPTSPSPEKMTGEKLGEGPDYDHNDPTPRKYKYTSKFTPIRGKLPDTIPEDKRFIHYALRQIGSSDDIAYINGPRGKRLWDLNNPNPHGLVNDKLRIRKWEQIASIVNSTLALSQHSTKAVHIHNEMKIGDVLLVLVDEYRRKHKIPFPKPAELIPIDRTALHQMMDYGQPPIVMTNSIDENWGFLSTFIANRTTKWINMTNHLRIHYSSYGMFKDFIDSDKMLFMFCSSHVDPMIGAHEKILSLPLGIKARTYGFARAQLFKELGYNKTKLLTINNSGWGPRSGINEMVAKAFEYTVRNSYSHSKKKGEYVDPYGRTTFMDHFLEIAQSKFVLCPSGLGYDTYRMWEVILMGSIPVLESNAGFDRTYASLPVLVIQDYKYLTPELLMKAYPCFVKHAHEFKYEMLREDYWVQLFQTAVVTGSIEHVMENHPFRHKYCDFLDYRPATT